MAAVIDCSAGFWGVVHGAEVLPFACAHFGARLSGAGRVIGEEGDDDGVCFLDEETSYLIEPDVARGVGRRGSELTGNIEVDGLNRIAGGGVGEGVVQGFEVFC